MDSFGGLPLPADEQQQRMSCFHGLELSDIVSLSGLSESTLPVATENPVRSRRKSSRLPRHDHGATVEDEQRSHELQMAERLRKRRDRPAPTHNSSETEKRRRERIEAKMKLLRQLIPNSEKLDKASLLDKAIHHIKALKWQLQVMQAMRRVPLQSVPPPGTGMLQCLGTAEQLSFASRTELGDVRLRAAGMIPDASTTVPVFFGTVPYFSSSSLLEPASEYYYVSPFFPMNTPFFNWPA